MASPTSSPVSLILLPLPCGPVFLSKHRRQFLSPRTGYISAKGAEQRLLRPPVTSRRRRGGGFACFSYNSQNKFPPPSDKSSDQWPILRRWDVPWEWQTVALTMMGCGVSFVLTGLVEQSALQYVGFKAVEATIDEKAEILFLGQLSVTLVVLGVIFGITNTFRPLPDDVFRYDIKEPFKLQNGWLLWAGVGLFGAIVSIALAGAAMTYLNGDTPEREADSLVLLLPLIVSSTTSTAFLVGITGVLAPLLEETVFRGFLTKWFPTPLCVVVSAAVFALAHLLLQVSYSTLCSRQCCCICPSSSDSWTIFTTVHTWYCTGVFICSNPQSSNSHHNTRILELRSDITANLSSAARIRYQGALGGIVKAPADEFVTALARPPQQELLVLVLLFSWCIQAGMFMHPCNPR